MSRESRGLQWIAAAALGLAGCGGCSEHDERAATESTAVVDEIDLPAVDEPAAVDPIEALGPHKLQATTVVTDLRDGEQVGSHTTVVQLVWRDWDHFRLRRLVDDRPVSEVRMRGGEVSRKGPDGRWQPDNQPDLARTQLRTAWDPWKEALDPFGERVEQRQTGESEVAGRKARQFELGLAAPAERGAGPGAFEAISLTGTSATDDQTGVRLAATVQGEAVQGTLTRRISLSMERTPFDPTARTAGADGAPAAAKARSRGRGKAGKRRGGGPFGGKRNNSARSPAAELPSDPQETVGDGANNDPGIDAPLE